MMQRIRDLKVQSENDTLNTDDLGAIEKEIVALGSEIDAITTQTKFNGIALLSGATSNTVSFQVGAEASEQITANTSNLKSDAAVNEIATITTGGLANLTLTDVDNAIKAVSTRRADLGAVQNRLEHRLNNLATYQENLVASESRIRDVDMAQEMVNFSKLQILSQAGTAMLAQANQSPQGVLSLLR
jgi:flagellin